MFYFEIDADGYVASYGTSTAEVQRSISAERFEMIAGKIRQKPTAPDGYTYKLRADTLEWELVELPPMPEPELTDEEALEILLGGAT